MPITGTRLATNVSDLKLGCDTVRFTKSLTLAQVDWNLRLVNSYSSGDAQFKPRQQPPTLPLVGELIRWRLPLCRADSRNESTGA